MNPPMIVRIYKNEETLKFLFWVWNSRWVHYGIIRSRDENRALNFFKLSKTIASSKGREKMPIFLKHTEVNHW